MDGSPALLAACCMYISPCHTAVLPAVHVGYVSRHGPWHSKHRTILKHIHQCQHPSLGYIYSTAEVGQLGQGEII